jgi:hypothetical protein
MKKIVFRNGDKIKIITPEIFVRCGYPKTIESETKVVIEEQGNRLIEMLKELGLRNSLSGGHYFTRVFNKIAREIAYGRLKQNGFGGCERKIYTRTEDIKGKEFRVVGKRRVKTGMYNAPSGGYDSYNGEYDYDPGYLDGEKTHVILEIRPCDIIQFITEFPLEIEEINVEKL